MKDTIFQTGNILLTHFAATGVSKRVTSVKLDGGFSFQLDAAGTGVEFVAPGREPGLVESFGTHELAATALHRLRNKVVAGARFKRARLILRGACWLFAAAVLLVFVLSLNTIATSLLVRGTTAFTEAAVVPVDDPIGRTAPPSRDSSSLPPAADLAEALAGGEASGKYTVGLSEGSEGTLYVFSDPSCPHCRRLEGALEALQGKVKVVVFPVTVFGGDRSKTALDQVFCAEGAERRGRWGAAIDAIGGAVAEGCSGAGDFALAANNEFFHAMGFEGTPSIVNGNGRVFPTNRAASADNLLAWAKAE